VTNIDGAPTYEVTRDKAGQYGVDANPAWKKGATVVNYGQSGDGVIYLTASETNAPYIGVVNHAGSPWSSVTTRLRIGNLNGFLGYASDLYGIAIGETNAYLKYDPTNGLRIRGTIAVESMYKLPDDVNLVGYWSLDDGAGTNAVDNTGNANVGALNGDPQWTDGISGKCLDFDGTGDYVSVPDDTKLNFGTGSFSVSYWLNFNGVDSQQRWSLGKGQPYDATGPGWGIANWSTGDPVSLVDVHFSDGVSVVTSNFVDMYRGTWYHLLFVVNRGDDTLKTYVNAEYKYSSSISGYGTTTNAEALLIGTGQNTDNSSDCKIDEVRIYNRALTESEIKALYLYPSGNKSAAISGGQTPWASGDDVTKIDGGNIYTNTITASHINGAGFGTLTITSGKIAINTTDALEIQSGGNVKVLAGADIVLDGNDTDPGNILFEGSSYSVKCGGDADGGEFYISPETDNTVSIFIGKDSPWGNTAFPALIHIYSRNEIGIRATHSDYPTTNTFTDLTMLSGAGSGFTFTTFYTGTLKVIYMTQGAGGLQFYPSGDKEWDLGLADHAWDTAFADDFTNVADFYHLDSRDDLAAIKAIKGSGVINEFTGLEIIDDDTIPEWMLSKHKKDGEEIVDGKIIGSWKKGDIQHNSEGKPYLSLKLMDSLLMGAIRQLDTKIEKILNP